MPPGTIYADYQATTPVDPRVIERMAPHWIEEFGNPHSSDHVVGWRAADAVREAASSVAALIGADPDEVVFTSGATEANNLALLGLARRAPPSRRRILVSAIEHKCVLAAARALAEREGFTVETIPVDGEGFVDFDALGGMVDDTVLARLGHGGQQRGRHDSGRRGCRQVTPPPRRPPPLRCRPSSVRHGYDGPRPSCRSDQPVRPQGIRTEGDRRALRSS